MHIYLIVLHLKCGKIFVIEKNTKMKARDFNYSLKKSL